MSDENLNWREKAQDTMDKFHTDTYLLLGAAAIGFLGSFPNSFCLKSIYAVLYTIYLAVFLRFFRASFAGYKYLFALSKKTTSEYQEWMNDDKIEKFYDHRNIESWWYKVAFTILVLLAIVKGLDSFGVV